MPDPPDAVIALGILTFVKLEQLLNARFGNTNTFGILILGRLEQLSNSFVPILVTLEGIDTDVRLVQYANVEPFKLVILEGI